MRPHPFTVAVLAAALLGPSFVGAAPLPRTDDQGEALPEHAAARFGTIRFRHGGPITTLDISKDGKYIASGSRDRALRIWEADTGKLLRTLPCESPAPGGVAFSPDGKRIVTSLDSENIVIVEWDKADAKPRPIKATIAQGVVWSGDGKHVGCAVADDESVLIFEADSGKQLHKIKRGVRVAFLPERKAFAVGLATGDVKVLRLEDAGEIVTFPAPEGAGPATDLRPIKDKDQIAVAVESGTITVWDVKARQRVQTLTALGATAIVPGGNAIAAVEKGRVVVVDIKSGEKKATAVEANETVPFVYVSDGNRIVAGGPGNRVRVWNLTTAKELSFGAGHLGEVQALAFGPEGKTLISGGPDGLRVWDVATRKEIAAARRALPTNGLSLAAGGKRLVTGSSKSIDVWDPVDLSRDKPYPERPAFTFETTAALPYALAHTPDGNRLVFADAKKLVFADPARGATLPGLTFAADPISAAFGPTGRSLAVLTRDGLVNHWSVGSRAVGKSDPTDLELWKKRVQKSPRGAVVVSPNGLLIAASSAGRVVLMESVNGKQWYGFDRQLGDGDVQALAFSPDGRLIAAGHGGPEGIVRVWEVLTGKEVVAFRGHAGGVNAVVFGPKGERIASAGADTTILLWDLTFSPATGSKAMKPQEAWNSLDSDNTTVAYEAMGTLIREGPAVADVIRKGLKDALDNQGRIRKLIKDLDADDFRTRKIARAELEKEGLRAVTELNEALKRKPSPDAERQLRLIVETMEARGQRVPDTGLYGETLRAVRSIQVLERVGGPTAIEMLQTLADFKDGGRVAAEAKAALERLKR